jgi:membrane-bound serine protease (ClpP class)
VKLLLLIAILTTVATCALGLVVALYAHKRAASGDLKLIGEAGYVDNQLSPTGTVLVNGELWRAKSANGSTLDSRTRVRVVGFANQLAIVEPLE